MLFTLNFGPIHQKFGKARRIRGSGRVRVRGKTKLSFDRTNFLARHLSSQNSCTWLVGMLQRMRSLKLDLS